MELVDSHVHLHFPEYDTDRQEVIQRAQEAGVSTFLNVGTDVDSSRVSIDLAEEHSFVFATAGIHPHDAKNASPEALAQIEKMLDHPRVVGMGEIGLDYFREHSPHDVQRETLKAFLQMYDRVQKPMIIHCRDAYDDFITIMKEHQSKPYQGVMHCYSSDRETMLKLVELGFYISFAGPLTYKKNDELRDACEGCPLDRILLETDAPFLPPQSMRGKRNETAYMIETAQMAADLKGVSLEDLGQATTENTRRLFKLS